MHLHCDYQAALDYIFNYVDYERRRSVPYDEAAWNLDRTRRVLAALGDPHAGLRYVHVAGSKGKGSTAANVEAVLRASGLRTGFYTSPHLHTFRERIRVDGALISQEDVVRLLAQCQPAVEAVPGITTFEIITALALLHFAQQRVAWVVLEVGLGGRLDATNVVTPAVSVITPISYEHTALLGNTLDKIAREKAGIIKAGVPVVCAPQAGEALTAIQQVADQQGSSLVLMGRDWRWRSAADDLDGQVFEVTSPADAAAEGSGQLSGLPSSLRDLYTPLLGSHQLANATTAIAACDQAARLGAPIDEQSVRRGLAAVVWPARLEILQRSQANQPAVVVDSAHNDTSARLLRSALASYFPGQRVRLVVGVSNDKDIDALLGALLPGAEALVAVRSRHPRASDPAELAQRARALAPDVVIEVAETVAAGLATATDGVGSDVVVCLAGSLFVAAEGREAWLARHPRGLPAGDWAYQAEPFDPTWQVSQTPNSLAVTLAGGIEH